jgi:hypothetical protein
MSTDKYMINVDFETPNEAGGQPGCNSNLHRNLGHHFDLTVHELGAPCRGQDPANRPDRYWDDNNGNGYDLPGVVVRICRILQIAPSGTYVRRCRRCKVPPHPPCWD